MTESQVLRSREDLLCYMSSKNSFQEIKSVKCISIFGRPMQSLAVCVSISGMMALETAIEMRIKQHVLGKSDKTPLPPWRGEKKTVALSRA